MLVTACGSSDNDGLAEAEERAADQAPVNGKIKCAVNGATDFATVCEEERLSSADGVVLIVRHPDGGFRRFNVLTDGRGLEAADGSEKAKIEIVEDNKIMISVGADQYVLSARMKAPPPPVEVEVPNEEISLPSEPEDTEA